MRPMAHHSSVRLPGSGYSTPRLRQPTNNYFRELKQLRRRQQHKPHKFAYSTMKNSIFARFAHAFVIF